jgi:HEAT repeat protein
MASTVMMPMGEEQIAQWMDDLDANRPKEIQERAIRRLVQLGSAVLVYLLPILRRPEKKRWHNIVQVIRRIGYPANAPAIPALLEHLQDINWPGAFAAVDTLAEIGEPIIPHVREVLREHGNDEMWMLGISYLLERMDPVLIAPLTPELLHLLEVGSEENGLDEAVMVPLGRIGSPAEDAAIPLLCARAVDRNRREELRVQAIQTLKQFKPPAVETAIPPLCQCLDDPSPQVREAAHATLESWQKS